MTEQYERIMIGSITNKFFHWLFIRNADNIYLPILTKVTKNFVGGFNESEIGDGYNFLITEALKIKTHLLILDYDVLPPKEILIELMKTGKQCISGVYFTKSDFQEPLFSIKNKKPSIEEFKDMLKKNQRIVEATSICNGAMFLSYQLLKYLSEKVQKYNFHFNFVKKDLELYKFYEYKKGCGTPDIAFFELLYREKIPMFIDIYMRCGHFNIETEQIYNGEEWYD